MLHLKPRIKNPSSDLQLCLDTYVIRDKGCIGRSCSGGNLPDKLEIAAKAGFRAVELWNPDVENYLAAGGKMFQLRDRLRDLGLSVPSYKVVEEWGNIHAMERAAELGAESCVVKVIRDRYAGKKPSLNSMVDGYSKLLEQGNNLQIRPSLEFMALAPYFNSIDSVCDILDRTNHPKASMVLDTWHLWRKDNAQFSSCPFHRIRPEWITVVHFTDARKDISQQKQQDGDRKMPGEGCLNLPRFLELLRGIGFGGYLSLNVYDQSLWHEDPLRVATRGHYAMHRLAEQSKFQNLGDGNHWKSSQDVRCDGLWTKAYWTHLDPRIGAYDRDQTLDDLLGDKLLDKRVVDFKCGFSPLAKYVTVGFDAYQGCIDYLSKEYPNARWVCASDEQFANTFDEPIDVLMHLGLGDSLTEIESHIKLRNKCKPNVVIIECAATDDGKVKETKPGQRHRWSQLKSGLVGKEHFYKTNMPDRSNRLVFVGENAVS